MLFLSSMFLIILQYIWMMSSLVCGLDICVQGGDVRVSTGRCFIFVMKYIKLTYIQAGIMFISFVVVECLYLIHWKTCKNVGRGWRTWERKACQSLLARVHQCSRAVKRAIEWLKHGNFIVSGHTVAYSTETISPVLCVTGDISHKHANIALKWVQANHTRKVKAF